MSEWQPIETAPKDGTPFLAYVRGEHVVAAWKEVWVAGNWELVGIQSPPMSNNDIRTVTALEGKFGGKVQIPGPTHWMPLPAPPAEPHAGALSP